MFPSNYVTLQPRVTKPQVEMPQARPVIHMAPALSSPDGAASVPPRTLIPQRTAVMRKGATTSFQSPKYAHSEYTINKPAKEDKPKTPPAGESTIETPVLAKPPPMAVPPSAKQETPPPVIDAPAAPSRVSPATPSSPRETLKTEPSTLAPSTRTEPLSPGKGERKVPVRAAPVAPGGSGRKPGKAEPTKTVAAQASDAPQSQPSKADLPVIDSNPLSASNSTILPQQTSPGINKPPELLQPELAIIETSPSKSSPDAATQPIAAVSENENHSGPDGDSPCQLPSNCEGPVPAVPVPVD